MLAKSKLDSSETITSQVMIDLKISHEELKTTANEKEKYERMKENIKILKSCDELEETRVKKNSMYKMFKIVAETFAKNHVYNIIDK